MSMSGSGSTLSPEDDSVSSGKDTPSLAARRARLRGTLRGIPEAGKAETTPGESSKPSYPSPDTTPSTMQEKPAAPIPSSSNMPANTAPGSVVAGPSQVTLRARPSFGISMSADITRGSAAETLKNIDQAMSVCAANLANLQKVAAEQANALKTLTETLQDKSLHDAGINLNTLTESFSAALEPMKEVSRLVPAIDQLNTAVNEHIHREDKITPDDLIASLSRQLAEGAIDAETFKSAYKAIFPDKSAADLLRELVELLGTQRLSGSLFRAAYDAVQSGEQAAAAGNDPAALPAFEELSNANQELQEALRKKEQEMQKLLADKELELQNVQAQMAKRYEEFNSQHAKAGEQLGSRELEYDALLKSKDSEITERESELVMLRRQMEELRSQTQELVSGLQKQTTSKPAEAPVPVLPESKPTVSSKPEKEPIAQTSKPAGGFFETAEQRPQSFYADTAIAVPAAQGTPDQPAAVSQGVAATTTATPPRPIPGAGRHGTGVRAQVFEVIVRQALAGAPWREMCAGPMQVNNITAEEVEAEVKRRQENLS